MSGHTAACRSRYSVRRSGRTWSVKQARGTRDSPSIAVLPPPAGSRPAAAGGVSGTRTSTSEVEVVDVVLVEHGGLAEDDDAVLLDRVVAEVTGGEGVALGTGDLAGGQRGAGACGQVAELLRVPQRERGDGAVLDELPHLVGGAQAGQRDLALGVGAGQVAG